MGIFRVACSVCLRLYRVAHVFIVRALISLFSVAGLYVVALVSLFVFQNAHAARTIIVEPSQLQRTYTPGTSGFAFSDSRSWNADVSTQRGSKVNVPVVKQGNHGWPGFRAGLKNLLKVNPARAAATTAFGAAMVGLDWVMNEGAISKQSPPTVVAGGPSWANNDGSFSGISPHHVVEDVRSKVNPAFPFVNRGCVMTGSLTALCSYTYNNNHITLQVRNFGATNCSAPAVYDQSIGACAIAGALVPVADSDIDTFLSDYSDPLAASELAPVIEQEFPDSFLTPDSIVFTGPPSLELPTETTTSTDPVTGSTTVTEVLPSIQFEYATEPLSVTATPTEVRNEYKDGALTKTSTTTITSTSTATSVKTDIPTDCEFMPTVCAFIDWVKLPFTEPEPDFSEIMNDDEDFLREVVFNSNASCPAPLNISTALGDFDFSFDPACTFAGMFKPLFLSLCLLAAIYITLGAIRGGE